MYVEGTAGPQSPELFPCGQYHPWPLRMFRKVVLQRVGGYDHDTFAEDCDLTLKMLMLGWHIVYEPLR